MPVRAHDTASAAVRLLNDAWTTESVPRLPPDLEAQARAHGAFMRVRGLTCASDLLRAVLVYALDGCSFRMLGIWAVLAQVGTLSDSAWRKRLQHANAFLLWLLGAVLAAQVSVTSDLARRQRRILLVDATCLRQVGGSGDDWRVHLAYDLLGGRMAQVRVTDQHGAEGLGWCALTPGDLIVADRGYGYRGQVVTAQGHGADSVDASFSNSCARAMARRCSPR